MLSEKRPGSGSSLAWLAFLSSLLGLAPLRAHPGERPWMNSWLPPAVRAEHLLSQLTLDEKIQLVHGAGLCGIPIGVPSEGMGGAGFIPGIPRLGIPDLNYNDGPVGVGDCGGRPDAQATALPASIAHAATWNPRRAYDVGALTAKESRDQGMNVLLGGGINLAREPRCGRTFEYLGEDPVLAGKLVAQKLRGTQDQHVVGTIKHLAGNQQETGRTTSSSNIDERTLRELYLLGFEIGIRESGVGSVMCGYNKVNGVYSCENRHLLDDILKGEWGFEGVVQSDWGATHSTVLAANSGLDEEQFRPEFFGEALKQAVLDGEVPLGRLDDMVRRKLRTMFQVGLFDWPVVPQPIDVEAGERVAQRAEEEGAVLLKNARYVLPLHASELRSIAVIGSHADVAVLSGGGSSQVVPAGGPAIPPTCDLVGPGPSHWCQVWMPSSPLNAIRARAPRATVRYDAGSDPAASAALAATSDVAIVFASQWEVEGQDLQTLTLPDAQDELISQVAAANRNTVVVLESGSPVLMPWIDSVPSVLEAWYPGIRGAEAIVALLFGDVNPSGKLPITFPRDEVDLPTGPQPPRDGDVTYSEGLFMGYRWYDARGIEPLFPFGHGLSYTQFAYAKLRTGREVSPGDGIPVSFTIRNTGGRPGAEVAQVYVGLPASTGEPPRRLVAWEKLELDPGERRQVVLTIPPRRLAIWDVAGDRWEVLPGTYALYVGASSRDIRLVGSVLVRDRL
jgi:beta-glucosidase